VVGTPRCGVPARAAAGGTSDPATSNHIKNGAAFNGTAPTARAPHPHFLNGIAIGLSIVPL
jgi:hypothetical protein